MIGVIFNYGNEVIEVRVQEKHVHFRTSKSPQFVDIDDIKLDKSGVLKEFPDLKGNDEWAKIAREKFKEKIKNMQTEKERVQYVIDDLSKFGYVPLYLQRQGHRPIKL